MPKGYSLEYNDFSGGLNTRLPASQIARNEAQTAVNVDLRSGALKSIKDLGTALTSEYLSSQSSTFASGRSLHFAASAYFMDDYSYTGTFVTPNPSNFYRQYLDDGDVTYFTNASTYPQRAVSADSKAPTSIGVIPPNPPTNLTKASGALSGRFKYAITFFTSDGVESNPTFFADISLSNQGIQFTLPQPKNSRVIGARIYRTRADEDVYFLAKEVYGVTTTTTINVDTTGNETQLDIDTQLTWAQGGFPSSGGQYIEDHSPCPTLTAISNRLHAGNSTGRPGAGIVFGAAGASVRWSILGAPDYWPVVNEAALPGVCEALISISGTTFAFTATGVFQLIGASDDAISVTQTNAAHGVKPGTGHLVTDTPFGILYQSSEGLVVFNGSSSTVFSTNKLALSTVDAYTYHSAVFYDNQWFLFHTAGALVVDLQDGIGGVRFWNYTPSANSIAGAAVATFDAPIASTPFASPLGVLNEVVITDGGTGYTSIPTGSVSAPSGGIAATVEFSGSIESIVLTNVGAGYTAAPLVTIAPPTGFGGVQAKAIAFIVNGVVVAIEITEPGSGYTSVPTVTIAAPISGTQATGTARATITGARVTQTGFGFSTNPSVTPSGGSPTRAVTAVGIIQPLGLYQHGAVLVGTQLFVMGGLTYTPAPIDSTAGTGTGASTGLNVIKYMQVYNTTTRTWSAKASMPLAMHSISPVTDGTDIWVWRGATDTTDAGSATAALYKYTVSTNTWSVVATVSGTPPTTGLSGVAAWYALLGGSKYMYLWGGLNNLSATPFNRTLYRVGLTTGGWEQVTFTIGSGTIENAYSAVAVNGSNVYVFGGRDTADETNNTSGGLLWNKFVLSATMSSTTGSIADDQTITARDSSTATTLTVGSTTYIILYGGQFIDVVPEVNRTYSSMWVFNTSTDTFTKQVNNVLGLNELRGHTMTKLSNGSVVIYGGVSAGTVALPESTGIQFSPRGAFDPATVTTMYVTEGSSSSWSVKPWGTGSTYLAMQWRGRDETSPLPGQQHVMTRFRLDYEGDPQLSIFADGTEEPGGGSFFFDGASSASRTQARQWLPSAASTRPDGRRLSVQFKSPSAAGNDTVVYRFEVDGKTDGS